MTDSPDLRLVPRPVTAGTEMEALRRFFPDVTWTGTIVAGGMGPGSPRMTATGRGTHTTIQEGLWIVGDYEQDQRLDDGTFVLTWRLHWVAGWNAELGAYCATHADNYGRAGIMTGHLHGDVLVFETPEASPVRLRMRWDRSDPARMRWSNEIAVGSNPFMLVEEYELHELDRDDRQRA